MVIRDNSGKKISEINVIVRPGGSVITTNAVYSGDGVITQNISTRDNGGNVKTETVYGGKVLPRKFGVNLMDVEIAPAPAIALSWLRRVLSEAYRDAFLLRGHFATPP